MLLFNALKGSGLPDDWPSNFEPTNWIKEPVTHTNGVINIPGIEAAASNRWLNFFDVETIWNDDDLMESLVKSIRENFRGIRYGFYGHAPTRYIDFPDWFDYFDSDREPSEYIDMLVNMVPNVWAGIDQDITQEPKLRHTKIWLNRVNTQIEFAKHVDVYFPSLYAFRGWDHWLKYAAHNISQIRVKYPEKPIYPFIWPHLHNTVAPENTEYPYWPQVLDWCERYCDGAVVWTQGSYVYDPAHQWVVTLRSKLNA